MLHIRNLEEGVELFKVLGSDIRVNIILLLLKEKEMNMNEIAARLQITNGALTSHIRKLEEAGLIRVTQDSVGHGNPGGAVFGLSGISHLRHFHDEKDDR